MKFLVVGLGSMGKRRIRNLNTIGGHKIFGIDVDEGRRRDAERLFNIKTYARIEEVEDFLEIDAFIISVPPDRHMQYAIYAIDNNKHCFIEASVVDDEMDILLKKMQEKPYIKICPSCTLRFHPSIKLIKKLLDENKIGKISNFNYHSGQYLPDWHPWEKISDFYVSNRNTGGCREIVPFELTWINWAFGALDKISGFYGKTIDLGVDIDDVYTINLKYKSGAMGAVVIDVVSRHATRFLIINGDRGQIRWDWDNKYLDLYDAERGEWVRYDEPTGQAAVGYNNNIIEEMYVDEIKNYIDAINGINGFINSIESDLEILHNLYQIESSNNTNYR